MRLLQRFLGVAIVSMLGATSVQAGELLKLKSGTVRPLDLQGQLNDVGGSPNAIRAYVVQFANTITKEDRQNLTTLGATVVRYLPDDALIVKASSKLARTIAGSSSSISTVIPFQYEWKIASDITPGSVFSSGDQSVVVVRMFPGEKEEQVTARVQSLSGAKVIESEGGSVVVQASRLAIAQMAAIDGVEWIQTQPKFKVLSFGTDQDEPGEGMADDVDKMAGDYTDLSGYESGTKIMNFDTAWKRGFTGKNQIVGMADTGLDSGDIATIHTDFQGHVSQGFAVGLFSKSWADPMGHGTHVAGSVMSSGAKSMGALKGGAYDSTFVAQSMWSPMLGGLSVPSKMGDLLGKAYNAGARIHTNSWGSAQSVGAYDAFAQQVDEFIATHPDMLVLFAAGNSGVDDNKDGRIDANSISSPGTAKNILTVGASKNLVLKGGYQKKMKDLRQGAEHWGVEPIASSELSENAQGMAAFSSRGPTADGRTKPEIVAPGTNILSVRSQQPTAEPLWGEYNKDYVWSGGTSMATPLTAGAATVLRQYLVEDRKIANPSGALMKAALIHTATDLFPGQFGEVGQAKGQEQLSHRPNSDQGYGRVDMDKATDLAKAVLIDERTGLATGDVLTYPVKVSSKAKLTATLVYTDAAGAAAAAKSLVNDLDLIVVEKSSGKETTLNDRTNNSEMIEMEANAGDYEVRVKGFNVPQGPAAGKQPYALVLSVQ